MASKNIFGAKVLLRLSLYFIWGHTGQMYYLHIVYLKLLNRLNYGKLKKALKRGGLVSAFSIIHISVIRQTWSQSGFILRISQSSLLIWQITLLRYGSQYMKKIHREQ